MYISQGPAKPSDKIVFLSCHFSPPHFLGPKGPRAKMSTRGVQIWPQDQKNKKMRAEKWCRSPPELIQTEPGGASYGQKNISGATLDFWRPFGTFWDTFGVPLGYLFGTFWVPFPG